MNEKSRKLAYIVTGLGLVVAFLASPAAWATPSRSALGQTVPTRTPTSPPPGQEPTDTPPAPPPPANTDTAPQTPAAPLITATAGPATSTPLPSASLRLTLKSDVEAVWQGRTVKLTLTLANNGLGTARQVVVEQVLPAELEPGEIVSGGASWNGRTLRFRSASLPSRGQVVIVYTVRVAEDASLATPLAVRAAATAAGGLNARAVIYLASPPVELPPTGAERRTRSMERA